MPIQRRSAIFDSVLVYLDEPQVITLVSRNTRIIAVAIPYGNPQSSMFLATTVTPQDWQKYLDGSVDLRYLFTFPKVRILYHFDLNLLQNDKVMMTPWVGDLPDEYLPLPRFFSTNHTEEYAPDDRAADKEKLLIDGEWELTDFGQFQQKFADIYGFIISTNNYADPTTPIAVKGRIKGAFQNRPFAGGFSYVHLFQDLNDNVPRSDQLNLDKIQYASPGHVEVFGRDDVFEEIHAIVPNFLEKRDDIHAGYHSLHRFLSERHLLKLSGAEFLPDDPNAKFVASQAKALAKEMLAPDYNTVWELTNENALVTAKVVLSFYRRLNDAAAYFAQGRISYPE